MALRAVWELVALTGQSHSPCLCRWWVPEPSERYWSYKGRLVFVPLSFLIQLTLCWPNRGGGTGRLDLALFKLLWSYFHNCSFSAGEFPGPAHIAEPGTLVKIKAPCYWSTAVMDMNSMLLAYHEIHFPFFFFLNCRLSNSTLFQSLCVTVVNFLRCLFIIPVLFQNHSHLFWTAAPRSGNWYN